MNRTAKKELRNRGLRVQKTPRSLLKEPGVLGIINAAIHQDGPDASIRKAHKGEAL